LLTAAAQDADGGDGEHRCHRHGAPAHAPHPARGAVDQPRALPPRRREEPEERGVDAQQAGGSAVDGEPPAAVEGDARCDQAARVGGRTGSRELEVIVTGAAQA
jgi:hypothetical protein